MALRMCSTVESGESPQQGQNRADNFENILLTKAFPGKQLMEVC